MRNGKRGKSGGIKSVTIEVQSSLSLGASIAYNCATTTVWLTTRANGLSIFTDLFQSSFQRLLRMAFALETPKSNVLH